MERNTKRASPQLRTRFACAFSERLVTSWDSVDSSALPMIYLRLAWRISHFPQRDLWGVNEISLAR